MPNPPPSTQHSDIHGVHQDEKPNVESANQAGQDGGDLERANRQSPGRPPASDDRPNREDRSRK